MRREKNGWEITEIFPKLIKCFSPLIKKPVNLRQHNKNNRTLSTTRIPLDQEKIL